MYTYNTVNNQVSVAGASPLTACLHVGLPFQVGGGGGGGAVAAGGGAVAAVGVARGGAAGQLPLRYTSNHGQRNFKDTNP